ncbi:hypothetical protein ARMGADRAFT_1077348 [Armillaria gallica]|uniref:HNH nuclease domain-containing protein n=1 Tax=Armillaria gallica TaxID=47427 RepID=A0A2H3DKR7_ARMGA|nr:hypothetical protein ARMGADRAFT_1077348 [Armillaria gallica]
MQRTISSEHTNSSKTSRATPKWLTALGGPGVVVAILSSMLDYAPNVRYVASAICACKSISQLALAWFAYFLWPFKALNWYYYMTREEEWLHSDLREQLLRQQDYHCPVTGMVELGQPKLSSEWMGSLGIFHILQRPRVINSRRNTQIDFFGPITREIIQNYICTTMDLDSVPRDDPNNAIALELNTCSHLSDFRMSLKATGNPNEYAVERYGECLCLVLMNDVIVFKEGTLPDPRYLHLHACVADVLQ